MSDDGSGISDEWWSNFLNLSSVSHMLVTAELPNAEQSFTITAMTAQWYEFLKNDCGYATPEPELVAKLVAKHVELFTELLGEMQVEWDAFQGTFLSLTKVWTALKGDESTDTLGGMFTWMWKDAFDIVVLDHFESIEADLYEEKNKGLD